MANKTLNILINPAARSVPQNAKQEIAAIAQQINVSINPIIVSPEKLQAKLTDPVLQNDEIAVWGGDGTIACALSTVKKGTHILPIPGGTMNLLHKAVHGASPSVRELLDAYSKGTLARSEIPTGEINGHSFYVGVICGHLAELATVREALRKGQPITALSELFASNSFDLSNKLAAVCEYKGTRNVERDGIVALAAFLRSDHSAPFEIGALNSDTIFDMTTTALEALLDGWENASSIDSFYSERLEVSSDDDEIPVTIDGELHQLSAPLLVTETTERKAQVLAWKA